MSQSLKMAFKSIAGNKMRAFLTMLGIIIGVMALVTLVSLVNGAASSVTDTISGLGNNLLTVTVEDNKGTPVKLKDLNHWMEEDSIGLIAPAAEESMTGKYGAENSSVEVYGTTPCYETVQGLSLLLGRFLKTTDVECHNMVCVINETLATELVGYIDCLGEEISLNGNRFTVVGVLEDDENSLTRAFDSGSMVAYIPYTSMIRISTGISSEITSFYVSAKEGGTMEEAEAAITSILLERLDQDVDAFDISTQDILEDTMSSITSVLALLLGGIAAISLIVGGIGIMNIMLVTVTERTREIGIRKAIGASYRMILQQFLLEAVVLCMVGCAIGIFFSWGILRIVNLVLSGVSLAFSLQWNVVVIAVVFCFGIGVIFGLYPANKAAKMLPIDALRTGV